MRIFILWLLGPVYFFGEAVCVAVCVLNRVFLIMFCTFLEVITP